MLLPAENNGGAPSEGLRLRLRVWRRRPRLDAALAEGADPAEDPALSLRARQLLQRSTRAAIASTIHNLLDAAEEPPAAWGQNGPRPPLQRQAVLAARGALEALADGLCQERAVRPQAVALATELVWDPASPVYWRDADMSVAQWADAIVSLLETAAPSPSDYSARLSF